MAALVAVRVAREAVYGPPPAPASRAPIMTEAQAREKDGQFKLALLAVVFIIVVLVLGAAGTCEQQPTGNYQPERPARECSKGLC